MQSKIHQCGENLVIDLPKEVSTNLGWRVGDVLNLEAAEGGLRVTRVTTADDHAMEIARQCMDEYRETFEALAKS